MAEIISLFGPKKTKENLPPSGQYLVAWENEGVRNWEILPDHATKDQFHYALMQNGVEEGMIIVLPL